MDTILYLGLGLLAGLGGGYFIARALFSQVQSKQEALAKERADAILKEAESQAENLKKTKLLETKQKFIELKNQHEQETAKRVQNLKEKEAGFREKEQQVLKRAEQLKKERNQIEQERKQLTDQQTALRLKSEEVEKMRLKQVEQLERIANLTVDEARKQMAENLVGEAKAMSAARIKEIVDETKAEANKQAKKIILNSIQRTAAENAIENAVTIFPLESDEVKGRIIGREGRNIRAIEAACGVDIVVDDTPEAIVISGFDPVRREVARLSLHRLVQDGRIHPARIEEVVTRTTKQLNDEIREVGNRACIDLGIHNLHPELVYMVGRMKYRSSYGQNLLQHSREVANMSATMAAEMGLNAKLAKRAGLLHDIGKVVEDRPEEGHAIVGMKLAEKYGEHEEVCNAIGAHHDEIEMTSLLSPIVQACDAMSGSRPGARREIVEKYIQRINDLEALPLTYPGVTRSFAIQAGRELRVLVESEQISDEQSEALAFELGNRIQNEMQYPGQVKITVIREKRAVAFAKHGGAR